MRYFIIIFTLFFFTSELKSQTETQIVPNPNDSRVITTGVPFLLIASDARAAAMGDMGVATSVDAFSQHWNPSKYAFSESKSGFGISYTPYLSKLVNDISLGNITYFNRLNERSAFQEEDLFPVLLDLKSKNLISLLERQANKINTEAVEKSFEAKVSGDLLNNLEIIDLDSPSIIEPDDAKEEKKYILKTDKWFERNDQLKELNNIYRRLDRRNEYKVLHKISWIQPALPDEETPYVHEIFDTHGLLIRLYQSRYLHLDLIGYMNGNLESNENEEQIELIKFTALQESIPEDVEQIDMLLVDLAKNYVNLHGH